MIVNKEKVTINLEIELNVILDHINSKPRILVDEKNNPIEWKYVELSPISASCFSKEELNMSLREFFKNTEYGINKKR